jgi:DNA invertase Pin-like site-specific DNA recombinase
MPMMATTTKPSAQASSGSLRALGYVRVSTDEQSDSGGGLQAQRKAIEVEADRRSWKLVEIAEDAGVSGKSFNGRPGLADVLARLDRGDADALIVSKLDRLSRSVVDAAGLMERARRRGWVLVAGDIGLDTSSSAGELVANVMASVAQWERRAIGDRTREALAAKRAAGTLRGPLGRPPALPPDTRKRIIRQRNDGHSYSAIAASLNEGQVPTAQGGLRWYPATVRKICISGSGHNDELA